MDFANDNVDGFAAFYDRLRDAMMAHGDEYKEALKHTYQNSAEYRDAILRAYKKDGFALHADLNEPDERVRCEFWNFFCRQKYDVSMQHLLQFVPQIVRNLDERFWYNSYCAEAATEILDALVKTGAQPDGAQTIGEILVEPPFPLKPPPEFCPRISTKEAEQHIGPRADKHDRNLLKRKIS